MVSFLLIASYHKRNWSTGFELEQDAAEIMNLADDSEYACLISSQVGQDNALIMGGHRGSRRAE